MTCIDRKRQARNALVALASLVPTACTLAAPPVVLIDPSPDPHGSIGSALVLTPEWMIASAREKRFFAPNRTLHSLGALILWPRAVDGTPTDAPITVWPQASITGARFGEAIDLDRTTNRILAGEPGYKTSLTAPRARGRAQIVDLSADPPLATELIDPPITEAWLEFGRAVGLDGSTAVVTAPGYTPAGATGEIGIAYLFERGVSEAGVTWSVTHSLLPPVDEPAYLSFGTSVALHASDVVVGAPAGLTLPTHQHGRLYVYDRSSGELLATLTAPTPALGDRFGAVMADADDLLAVSAPGDECGLGQVHLFRRDSRGWTHEATLSAPGSDIEGWAGFGNSLSIDRERVMVGTGGFAGEERVGTKSAIFRRSGPAAASSWGLEAVVESDPLGPTGSPVALDPRGACASEAAVDLGQVRYQGLPPSADFDFDGAIGAGDLAILLGAWGGPPGLPTDLNRDGLTDQADLAILLGAWG